MLVQGPFRGSSDSLPESKDGGQVLRQILESYRPTAKSHAIITTQFTRIRPLMMSKFAGFVLIVEVECFRGRQTLA